MGRFAEIAMLERDGRNPARYAGQKFDADYSGDVVSLDLLYAAFREAEIECAVSGSGLSVRGPGHTKGQLELSITPAQTEFGYVWFSHASDSKALCFCYIEDVLRAYLDSRMREAEEYWTGRSLEEELDALTREAIVAPAVVTGSMLPAQADEDRKIRIAGDRWRHAQQLLIDAGTAYFASRGLEIPAEMIGRVIRSDAHGRWYNPAGQMTDAHGRPFDASPLIMYACRDVADDTGRGIQIVRMPHLGKKPARKIWGARKGAAIKLTPHKDVIAARTLVVSEGFESALAGMALGFDNVWALISQDNVRDLPVLPDIDRLVILGENCPVNKAAREACAERWDNAGREVIIEMPMAPGARTLPMN